VREDICYFSKIIDTYAPCIVGRSSRWNNIVNMETHCATTDRKVWSKKFLSMGEKAFILLCLINYGKRWLAESVKAEKMVRKKWFVLLVYQGSNQKLTYFVIVQNKKCVRGQMRTTKANR
jgi:hypothetical protein